MLISGAFVSVDICITTSFKQLENVCLLAEVLAQRKMHNSLQRSKTDNFLQKMEWSEWSVSLMLESLS